MRQFLLDERQLVALVVIWILSAWYLGPLAMAIIPITFILLRRNEDWSGLLLGMLIILMFSDIRKDIPSMLVFKSVKNLLVVLLAGFFFLQRERFQPTAAIFSIFLPFFIYSVFPLVFSEDLATATQKTLSYALMFLIVPNYVLYSFRTLGWDFFRNLMFLITSLLIAGIALRFFDPNSAYVGGRFHGLFGNPNGLAIFCFLSFMLMGALGSIRQGLFKPSESLLIHAVLIYCIVISGSRASLAAVLIYLMIARFFAYSPFLGFVVMVASIGVIEVVTTNLATIITALGQEEYFRLHTLEQGSGRYFAWQFAWEKIQDYLVFGGGFANDETVMRSHYRFLERMGHQGGVHNSYLSLWFNVGIVGLMVYFRSFILIFIKASKTTSVAIAVLFATLFSINYESWLVGSLNPYTIMLLIIMTVISEEEIAMGADPLEVPDEEDTAAAGGEVALPDHPPGGLHA